MKKQTHIRRCHVCGEVTESPEKRVEKCCHCGKPFAPFFYFDDRFIPTLQDNVELEFLKEQRAGIYRPIYGLTAYW